MQNFISYFAKFLRNFAFFANWTLRTKKAKLPLKLKVRIFCCILFLFREKTLHFFCYCSAKKKLNIQRKAISPFRGKPTNDQTSPDLMDLQNVGKLLNQVYALISELYLSYKKNFLICSMFRNTESNYRISSNSACNFIASFFANCFYC